MLTANLKKLTSLIQSVECKVLKQEEMLVDTLNWKAK